MKRAATAVRSVLRSMYQTASLRQHFPSSSAVAAADVHNVAQLRLMCLGRCAWKVASRLASLQFNTWAVLARRETLICQAVELYTLDRSESVWRVLLLYPVHVLPCVTRCVRARAPTPSRAPSMRSCSRLRRLHRPATRGCGPRWAGAWAHSHCRELTCGQPHDCGGQWHTMRTCCVCVWQLPYPRCPQQLA